MEQQQSEPFLRRLSSTEQRIVDAISPILDVEQVELVAIQVVPGKQRAKVRLFVDHWDDEKNPAQRIEVGTLQSISRQISVVLDVEENERPFFAGAYQLEVSSPGLDRPLTKKSHFEKAIHSVVAVQVDPAIDGARKFKGELTKATPDAIEVLLADVDKHISLPHSVIRNAHIIYQF